MRIENVVNIFQSNALVDQAPGEAQTAIFDNRTALLKQKMLGRYCEAWADRRATFGAK